MQVIKRNGEIAPVQFDEILGRVRGLALKPPVLHGVDCARLAQDVISLLVNRIRTSEIDVFTAQRAASRVLEHLDYETLAARILIDNHHKNTLSSFSETMELLADGLDPNFLARVRRDAKAIDARIDYERDFSFGYFGFSAMYEQTYLLRAGGDRVVERPQHMFMRVSLFIHDDLERAFETYDAMSLKLFTHASPTLFNAGLRQPGCISCFLAATDDSRAGIQRTAVECTNASASCGGIAFSATSWRPRGSKIAGGHKGRTKGIVPFIRWISLGTESFDQGGRRRGSMAVYLHVHHPDVMDFLKLKVHGGDETQRCRDVFLGLMLPDIFMERVERDEVWSFIFSPALNEMYGEEYTKLYLELEAAGKFTAQIRAREVWKAIYDCKRDSGIPYLLASDTINRTSNQKHLGVVNTSNLCAEIVQVCQNRDDAPEKAETACCTLASIALPEFVDGTFQYQRLADITGMVVQNLNEIIDKSSYPSEAARRGNINQRPLGIGVQGLADVYFKLRIAFDSAEARELNRRIFETIYYAALSKSAVLARAELLRLKRAFPAGAGAGAGAGVAKYAGAYPTFVGSPLHEGKFNFELFGLRADQLLQGLDWDSLRGAIQAYGVRNSLLIAAMPTATTSLILGNTECFEPLTSNIYLRKITSGEYYVVNKYLFEELWRAGCWTPEVVNHIKQNAGSIQGITTLPAQFRARYKTAWELPQKSLVQQAADRQPFVDQSQSMNLYFENFTLDNFTASHLAGWKWGLKTLSYYIRQRAAVRPQQFDDILTMDEERVTVDITPQVEIGCGVCGS